MIPPSRISGCAHARFGAGFGDWQASVRFMFRAGCLVLLTMVAGCEKKQASSGPRYADAPDFMRESCLHLAVHPLYNPTELLRCYGPLMDYLTTNSSGLRFELEASRDYGDFERVSGANGGRLHLAASLAPLLCCASG